MSITLQGIGISGGIAIGQAHLLSRAQIETVHYLLDPENVPAEIARFEEAIRSTQHEFEQLLHCIPDNAPTELGTFLRLHIMLLNDHMLSQAPIKLIKRECCNAEWALNTQLNYLLAQFDQIQEEYLQERRSDVIQVAERIFKSLAGKSTLYQLPTTRLHNAILVAHDFSPADVLFFKKTEYLTFITDVGGPTSHTAILARSLNLPSVFGLRHAHDLIYEGETLIVDGINGVVVIDPDQQVLTEYRTRQQLWHAEQRALRDILECQILTTNGQKIELWANIELPEDIAHAIDNGATGVGLFRSEFLSLNDKGLPTEEEQFLAYKKVVDMMPNMPVVIRTLDLSKDKVIPKWHDITDTPNPALGLTGIRLCIVEPLIFRSHLRAILRVSAYGKVKILLPMISQISEIKQTRRLIEEIKAQLRKEAIPFDEHIELGGAIEVPAAAIAITQFLQHLDFISIGTNDLIQYTLAVDRSNDLVSHLYDPLHPSVLQLIAGIIDLANRANKSVSLVGEMAGDPQFSRLLLGMGLRCYSMLPIQLLKVKQQLLNANLDYICPIVKRVLAAETSEEIRSLLKELNE